MKKWRRSNRCARSGKKKRQPRGLFIVLVIVTIAAVKVGDRVEIGQALARLDDTDARAQVAQAEANARLAEIKLAELTAAADPAAVAAARASLAAAKADRGGPERRTVD